jgi:hypothetical protein
MAAKDRFGRAADAARAAQTRGYIQRLVEDEELRGSLLSAYGSARSAYGHLNNGKPATRALFEDRKLQGELRDTAEALRDVSITLREPPKRHRRHRGSRSLLLLAFGAVLAVALSEALRSKVLDVLFGAEEEFDYSSTTAPSTPAPAAVAGS